MGTSVESEVARILLTVKAVEVNTKTLFVYTSGIQSPIYCDLRVLMGYPRERARIVDLMIEKIGETCGFEGVDVIAGVATSGIPWATLIAEKLGKRLAYVREEQKQHGKRRQVEGRVSPGDVTVVIEDHISTGGSAIAAVVEALREPEHDADVSYCFSILTYDLPQADKSFRRANLESIPLCKIGTLLETATSGGAISSEEAGAVVSWLRQQPAEATRVYPMHP